MEKGRIHLKAIFKWGKGEIEPTKLSGKSLCKENKTPRRPEQETLELSTRGTLFMIMWGCLEPHQYKTCFERPKIFMNTFRNKSLLLDVKMVRCLDVLCCWPKFQLGKMSNNIPANSRLK